LHLEADRDAIKSICLRYGLPIFEILYPFFFTLEPDSSIDEVNPTYETTSFGAAKVYDNKTTEVSTDFVENHLAKKFAPVKIERILTDCGIEYTT
jgi:hypothetical protein